MKFRKKPVVIEAVQFKGHNVVEVSQFVLAGGGRFIPSVKQFDIVTLEGTMSAAPGDWIIKGVKGEFYPCKPDIFAQTYEAVEENTNQEIPADYFESAK